MKKRIPAIRQRGAKVRGKMLAALRGVSPMLPEVRTKFNIPRVDPSEYIAELLAPGGEINWDAVRWVVLVHTGRISIAALGESS